MSYRYLSRFYDRLIDFDYQGYMAHVGQVKGVRCLDLACGTGRFSRVLAQAGASVEGVDLSEDMLQVAIETTRQAGLKVLYRQGNIADYDFTRPYQLVTVVCDGFNYVSPASLPKAIKHVADSLSSGGKLVFDISTPHKLKEVLGDNLYYEDADDVTYFWQNSLRPRAHSVDMQLTFFEPKGELYARYDEEQTQYWHTLSEVKTALDSAALILVSAVGEEGEPAKESDLRWIFTAQK